MATKANPQRNWTIMVYLAGDNNLDSTGVMDLNEMKSDDTTDRVTVLAQFDRVGNKGETLRYCLRKGTSVSEAARRQRRHVGAQGGRGVTRVCLIHILDGLPACSGLMGRSYMLFMVWI